MTQSRQGSEARCFGRLQARELDPSEIESVSGGQSYTGIQNFEIDERGDARFEYSDYTP